MSKTKEREREAAETAVEEKKLDAVIAATEGETVSPAPLAVRPEAGPPAKQNEYGSASGKGLEDVEASETLIPFIRILQSNSPQVENGTIAGAEAGMILNTATSELYDGDEGIPVVCVRRAHDFVEYVPRDQGGGFKGVHKPGEPWIDALRAEQGAFGKLKMANGNELTETYSWYVIVPGAFPTRGVVAFASTQIKFYRNLMGRLVDLQQSTPGRPPVWAFRCRFRTTKQKNKKGSFFGWNISLDGKSPAEFLLPPDDPLIAMGDAFYEMINKGLVRAEHEAGPEPDAESEGSAGAREGARSDDLDGSIPF